MDIDLPIGLERSHVRSAVEYIEKETSDLVDIYFEQANVFSAIVGIFGSRALDQLSPYKKHKHPDVAQQRFPDLSLKGRLNPEPRYALESKASKRPWAVQSHYDHPGWYIVWRYLIDQTQTIQPGSTVVVWRVDIAYLESSDWKYEKSTAGVKGGGRTHTFGLIRPARKLKGKAIYSISDVVVAHGIPTLRA